MSDDHSSEGNLTKPVSTTRLGVYLLPNLLTTGTLFGGFFSILVAVQGRYVEGAIAIFAAMIFDGLDGRVARMTGTQSQFGTQYDSLSDMVAFGVAPAILVFTWMLGPLDKLGWSAAFIYTSCAALRLARFNINTEAAPSRYFQGLASPPAAALLASLVWSGAALEYSAGLAILVGLIATGLGLLMVSNLVYPSFKDINFDKRVPFVVVLTAILIAGIIMSDPPRLLLLCATVYALSSPARWLYRRLRRHGWLQKILPEKKKENSGER